MDFSQIPMNPYGAQDMMSVEAAHAQGMLDPNMMPHNPYVPPPVSHMIYTTPILPVKTYKLMSAIVHISLLSEFKIMAGKIT